MNKDRPRSKFVFTYVVDTLLLQLIYNHRQEIYHRGSTCKGWNHILEEFNSQLNTSLLQSRTLNNRFKALRKDMNFRLKGSALSNDQLNENERLLVYLNDFFSKKPGKVIEKEKKNGLLLERQGGGGKGTGVLKTSGSSGSGVIGGGVIGGGVGIDGRSGKPPNLSPQPHLQPHLQPHIQPQSGVARPPHRVQPKSGTDVISETDSNTASGRSSLTQTSRVNTSAHNESTNQSTQSGQSTGRSGGQSTGQANGHNRPRDVNATPVPDLHLNMGMNMNMQYQQMNQYQLNQPHINQPQINQPQINQQQAQQAQQAQQQLHQSQPQQFSINQSNHSAQSSISSNPYSSNGQTAQIAPQFSQTSSISSSTSQGHPQHPQQTPQHQQQQPQQPNQQNQPPPQNQPSHPPQLQPPRANYSPRLPNQLLMDNLEAKEEYRFEMYNNSPKSIGFDGFSPTPTPNQYQRFPNKPSRRNSNNHEEMTLEYRDVMPPMNNMITTLHQTQLNQSNEIHEIKNELNSFKEDIGNKLEKILLSLQKKE